MTEIFNFKYVLQNTALREMYTQKQTVSPQTQAVSGGLIIVNIQKFVHIPPRKMLQPLLQKPDAPDNPAQAGMGCNPS